MTKKDYTEVHTILHLRRLNDSVMGNPAWMVTFDDLSFARTSSDQSWSYGAENEEFRDVPLLFTFTPAGRIRWAEQLTDVKPVHADYPHYPGTLYDCQACEDNCYCDTVHDCIYCETPS
jgi:hypothetical protein